MKKLKLLIASILVMVLLATQVYAQEESCLFRDDEHTHEDNQRTGISCDLTDLTQLEISELPLITVYVNVHYVGVPAGNFTPDGIGGPNGNFFATKMLEETKGIYADIQDGNSTMNNFLGDTRVRFEFYTEAGNQEDEHGGIWYWDSANDLTFPYGDKALNIIMEERGSSGSCNLTGVACGLNLCDNLTLHDAFDNAVNTGGGCQESWWNYGRLLAHEIGHVFGLRHSFGCINQCPGEIFPPVECVTQACGSPSSCNPWISCSNNMMGYNNLQNSLTMCQWSIIYNQLSTGTANYVDNCSVTKDFPMTVGFEESFEDWINVPCDDIDWLRVEATSPSFFIGPDEAAEGLQILLVQPTPHNTAGQEAILNSPCLHTDLEDNSFNFSYHIHRPNYNSTAANTGSLRFEISNDKGQNWESLWELAGDQGPDWNQASVAIPDQIGSDFIVRFVATSGNNWVAIDGLSSTCPSPEPPHFFPEPGFCNTVLSISLPQAGIEYEWFAENLPSHLFLDVDEDDNTMAKLGYLEGEGLSTNVDICAIAVNECGGSEAYCRNVPLECFYIGEGFITNTNTNVNPNTVKATVSPNPAGETVSFELKAEEAISVSINIYSLDGRLIRTFAERTFDEGYMLENWSVDKNIEDGVYLVYFKTNQGNYFEKLVISR